MSHALLSPSSAHRWLECTPSARLEAQVKDTSNAAAEEGTLAHSLAETMLLYWQGLLSKQSAEAILNKIMANEYYNEGMKEHAESYVAFVIENYEAARKHTKDAKLIIEAMLDLTEIIPEAYGTGDAVIIADGELHIIDLKYGKGVRVSCDNNKQMMLYALGALRAYDFMYSLDRVKMTIFQPRLDNISSYSMLTGDLEAWATDVLVPRAALAFRGEGQAKAGAHCRFCKVAPTCRANSEQHLKLAAYDFKDPFMLDDEEISDIMLKADAFKNWVNSVEEYARLISIEEGKRWPGFKLVEGRSVRVYADPDAVASKLINTGFDESRIYTKTLLGITAMEKLLSKRTFEDLLSGLVIKPIGKPTLVPESDKRPELSTAESAINDFKNDIP